MAIVHNSTTLALGTLASGAAVVGATKIDSTREQGVKLRKVKGFFNVMGKTVDEGPLIVGFSRDLNATEVQQGFEGDPQFEGETALSERANRPIFPVATIPAKMLDTEAILKMWTEFDIPSWLVIEGNSFDIFAFNDGAGALTTGGSIFFEGVFVYDWQRD